MSIDTRFRLKTKKKRDFKSDYEKINDYKQKLDSLIISHELKSEALGKLLISNALLNTENLLPDKLDELSKMGNQISTNNDKAAELEVSRNLQAIKLVTNSEVMNVTSELRRVFDEEQCSSEYEMEIRPSVIEHPEVVLRCKTFTDEKLIGVSDLPSICQLKLEVDGININSELEKALEYCQDKSEIQLALRLIREYLPLEDSRSSLIENLDLEHFQQKEDGSLVLINSSGVIQAVIWLQIQLNNNLDWEPLWRCSLSSAGAEACRRLHVPQELESRLTVADWDWETALDNLGKVAKYDVESPKKDENGQIKFDASAVDVGTPISTQIQKKVPKRKLN